MIRFAMVVLCFLALNAGAEVVEGQTFTNEVLTIPGADGFVERERTTNRFVNCTFLGTVIRAERCVLAFENCHFADISNTVLRSATDIGADEYHPPLKITDFIRLNQNEGKAMWNTMPGVMYRFEFTPNSTRRVGPQAPAPFPALPAAPLKHSPCLLATAVITVFVLRPDRIFTTMTVSIPWRASVPTS